MQRWDGAERDAELARLSAIRVALGAVLHDKDSLYYLGLNLPT